MLPVKSIRRSRPSSDSPEPKADSFGYSHVSNQSPLYTSPTGPWDPNLLSPPISDKGFDLTPFKPSDSDNTSLSMVSAEPRKKRKKRPPIKAHASASDARIEHYPPMQELGTSQSLPNMQKLADAQDASRVSKHEWIRQSSSQKNSTLEESVARPNKSQDSSLERRRLSAPESRRWTLRSKTRTAPVVSNLKAADITEQASERPRELEQRESEQRSRQEQNRQTDPFAPPSRKPTFMPDTPAMITLRRANSNYNSREDASDSAEPVKIWNSRYARRASKEPIGILMAQLIAVASLKIPNLYRKMRTRHTSPVSSSGTGSRDASLNSTRKQSLISILDAKDTAAIYSTATEPAITHVSISPTLAIQSNVVTPAVSRRTSTKVVTGSKVHDIIWEQDGYSADSSRPPSSNGSSGLPSRSYSKQSLRSSRRRSAATDALDATLRHDRNSTWKLLAGVSSLATLREPLMTKNKVTRPKRKTIPSLFRQEWHSEDSSGFQDQDFGSGIVVGEVKNEVTKEPGGTVTDKKPDARPNQVHFVPPLPGRVEPLAGKSPVPGIDSMLSHLSSRVEEDPLVPDMYSTFATFQRESYPNDTNDATDEGNDSSFDPMPHLKLSSGATESIEPFRSIRASMDTQPGMKMGASSRSVKESYDALLSLQGRNAGSMPSSCPSPPARGAKASPQLVLDGSYSSNTTVRGGADNISNEKVLPERAHTHSLGDFRRGRRLSVHEFVKRIEKLTAESRESGMGSKGEREKAVASWAEGLPASFPGMGRMPPMQGHMLKSRRTTNDKMDDLVEESGGSLGESHAKGPKRKGHWSTNATGGSTDSESSGSVD